MTKGPLRDQLDPAFDDEDVARVRDRVRATLRSRQRARRSEVAHWRIAAAVAAAVVLVGVWRLLEWPAASVPASESLARTEEPLRLARGTRAVFERAEAGGGSEQVLLSDGSRLLLDPGTRVEAVENTSSRVVLALGQGRAVFDVEPGGPRAWSIDAALLTVDVLGTRFEVERGSRSARVSVERGVVRVRGTHVPGGLRRLTAGESVMVELPGAATAAAGAGTAEDRPLEPQGSEDRRPARHGTPAGDWRNLVEAGAYDAAYSALGEERFARELRSATDAGTLLALADAARLSGHPAQAVDPLRRAIEDHPEDPRAAVAAFTLGRLYLESLRDAGQAATRFEQAMALGLPAALREAAQARLVEAHGRAGNAAAARAAARAYLERYPQGQHRSHIAPWL